MIYIQYFKFFSICLTLFLKLLFYIKKYYNLNDIIENNFL